MLDHRAALGIVLGAAFLTVFAGVILAGAAAGPEGDPFLTLLLYGVPFAIGILAVGIGGVALGRFAPDPVARGVGLLTSTFGIALAAAICYLFFVGDVAWDGVSLLVPAFALSTGIVGLRLLTAMPHARLQGVLLSGGLIATMAWVAASYLAESSAAVSAQETASLIGLLGFGVLILGWLAVGLIELRGDSAETTDQRLGA